MTLRQDSVATTAEERCQNLLLIIERHGATEAELEDIVRWLIANWLNARKALAELATWPDPYAAPLAAEGLEIQEDT